MDVKADSDSVVCGTASTTMVQKRVSVGKIPLFREGFIVNFSPGAQRGESFKSAYCSTGETVCFMEIAVVVWI